MTHIKQEERQLYSSGRILIKISKSGSDKTRIAFLVGTKFSKKAVKRNKLRRQLREIFRKKTVQLSDGLDITVMIKNKSGGSTDAKTLGTDLEKAIKKINIAFKKLDLN